MPHQWQAAARRNRFIARSIKPRIAALLTAMVPFFSEDAEKAGFPENLQKFFSDLDAHDAFVLACTKRNGYVSAEFKNLFDWVARSREAVCLRKIFEIMKTRHRPLFSVPDIRRRRLCITAAMAASGLLVGCAVSGFSAQGAKVGRRAYIVHGYGATPQDHWFPWLAAQLQQQGWQVKRIALPDAQAPDFTRWQAALADAIGTPVAGDIFIAHSLGTISLLHYLSNTRPARIGGLLLASGFAEKMPELGEINGFNVDEYVAQARLDLPAIAAMTPNIVSLVSDNDSIVAPRYSLKLAEALASRVIMIGNGGHLLAADGFVTLPEALQAVQAMR